MNAWEESEERKIAEAEALEMWPETLHLGRWDGLLSNQDIDGRLHIQRRAYVWGARAAWHRANPQTEQGGDE